MADTSKSNSPSRSSTPNPRFTSQTATAEDVLKEQTVGLVHLSDFRKRRAEAIEQISRDATPLASGATTPDGREPATQTGAGAIFKKRKKGLKKGGLSFGGDEDAEDDIGDGKLAPTKGAEYEASSDTAAPTLKKKGFKPNSSVSIQPKAMTKSALLRDAQLKESLRREYLQIQEAVKATEFMLPFVFFDGKITGGGACRIKKGDFIWLFLDRARKVGAESAGRDGPGGSGAGRKDWARIGVDDLMLVRGDIVVPHHYDFHHFLANSTTTYNNTPLFTHSADPTTATPQHLLKPQAQSGTSTPTSETPSTSHLKTAEQRRAESSATPIIPDSELEGYNDDPAQTKVVDRRWYERNKHIYPASVWEEFDSKRDYSVNVRKDGEGNNYFFSR